MHRSQGFHGRAMGSIRMIDSAITSASGVGMSISGGTGKVACGNWSALKLTHNEGARLKAVDTWTTYRLGKKA